MLLNVASVKKVHYNGNYMGIQNVPTSSTPSSMTVPTPPPLQEILKSPTTAPLSQNPLSGSILKLLADNGFKQKIEAGYAQGHTYTILHSAPSTDFTLIDAWTETRVDESGNTISVPRKKYHIFTITEPVIAPEPAVALESATDPRPIVTSESMQPIIIDTPPVQAPTPAEIDALRAQTIAEKIKHGGAGMTAEDWQFRNENWPLIEALLMPKSETTPNAVSDSQAISQTTPPTEAAPSLAMNTQNPEAPLVETPLAETTTSESPAANLEGNQKSNNTSNLTPQHYDARAWLMQKLKQGNRSSIPEQHSTSPVTTIRTQSTPENSYNLLKKRFSGGSETEKPPVPVENEAHQNPMERRDAFLKTIFGTNLYIWERAQSIPARAFIYPSEYTWGTNEQGKTIERSLEDYPVEARRLRQKIAQSVEDIATQGTIIETTPIGTVLDIIFNKGIL